MKTERKYHIEASTTLPSVVLERERTFCCVIGAAVHHSVDIVHIHERDSTTTRQQRVE